MALKIGDTLDVIVQFVAQCLGPACDDYAYIIPVLGDHPYDCSQVTVSYNGSSVDSVAGCLHTPTHSFEVKLVRCCLEDGQVQPNLALVEQETRCLLNDVSALFDCLKCGISELNDLIGVGGGRDCGVLLGGVEPDFRMGGGCYGVSLRFVVRE